MSVPETLGLTLDTLVPGTLVNCKVQSALSDGLVLNFLTYFTATVDHFHLPVGQRLLLLFLLFLLYFNTYVDEFYRKVFRPRTGRRTMPLGPM